MPLWAKLTLLSVPGLPDILIVGERSEALAAPSYSSQHLCACRVVFFILEE